MLRPGVADNLERFVAQGGVLLTTFFSGIVDQNDHVVLGGYPGELRRLLGLYVEEFDPWIEGMMNSVVIGEGPLKGSYACSLWGEVVHPEGANVLGYFANDYYAGSPALSMNQFGEGQAYYLATHGNEELLASLARQLCKDANVQSLLGMEEGLEVTQRQRTDGSSVYFLLNHRDRAVEVFLPGGNFRSLLTGEELTGRMEVAALDVCVLLDLGVKLQKAERESPRDLSEEMKRRSLCRSRGESTRLLDRGDPACYDSNKCSTTRKARG